MTGSNPVSEDISLGGAFGAIVRESRRVCRLGELGLYVGVGAEELDAREFRERGLD